MTVLLSDSFVVDRSLFTGSSGDPTADNGGFTNRSLCQEFDVGTSIARLHAGQVPSADQTQSCYAP